ncbi:MurR/RpiR family transcriptional regulator [Microbacterium album]|uniref:RpiR family transcriptional regulator n=1 Tax=Microbacterium album TaxID=2053191 RepID=A0A917IHV2_9MICO|nr:MurR/RpiR family transcriptional regulator [Microbacterium album]GGH45650.1 RpiR family transcriptional regulator [Microbacterium album]
MTTTTPEAPSNLGDAPLVERLRAALAGLTPAERRVAGVVLRDPLAVIHKSVSQLAQEAESSAATVVRLCTTLGLRGYQELKITLAREALPGARAVHDAVAEGDDAHAVARKVLGTTSDALARTADSLDASVLAAIARRIMGARRVLVGAVGTSAPLAQDIAYRLTTVGIPATFVPDVHTQHVTARMLGPEDLFFAISHTGSTFETLAAARAAQESGATTVALTSFATSPLTEVVDLSLIAGSAETAYRVEAMASRIVHLAVLDALYVLIALEQPHSQDALLMTQDVLIEHRI